MTFASSIPFSPVAAFEFPEFTTTARAVARGNRSRDTFTGDPQTKLVVNTPAAAHARSETNNAKSNFCGSALMPHGMPTAEKP